MVKTLIEPIPEDANDRTCVEVFDNEGVLIERSYGASPAELQQAHDEHRCDAFCGICYHEAMVSIGLE